MKRILLLFILIIAISSTAFAQKKFNSEHLQLRSSIELFLREEGFMPEIDKDGDIRFKKEGEPYYIIIDSRDTSPFYISLGKFFSYSDTFNRKKIEENLGELNRQKAVKVLLYNTNYGLKADMYTISAENFKYVFYKLMEQLSALQEEIKKICQNSSNGYTHGNGTSYIVNEDFTSYSSSWKKDDGKISYQNGKLIFEDLDDYGWSVLSYDLPKNLRNTDFELSFSLNLNNKNEIGSIFFFIGPKYSTAFTFGFTRRGDKLATFVGVYPEFHKYQTYTSTDLSQLLTHQYLIKKIGNNISWYGDGRLLFTRAIDSTIDLTQIGFFLSNKDSIEIDDLRIKLL